MKPMRSLAQGLGKRSWFAAVGKHTVPPLDTGIRRISRGRLSIMTATGLPTLTLTTTGRKTGRPRTVPLLYMPDGDAFVVVGSNWGQAGHPAWALNLLADPDAHVSVKGCTTPVRARLLDGEERDQMWPRLTRMWPAYETYVERAAGRRLLVFELAER